MYVYLAEFDAVVDSVGTLGLLSFQLDQSLKYNRKQKQAVVVPSFFQGEILFSFSKRRTCIGEPPRRYPLPRSRVRASCLTTTPFVVSLFFSPSCCSCSRI